MLLPVLVSSVVFADDDEQLEELATPDPRNPKSPDSLVYADGAEDSLSVPIKNWSDPKWDSTQRRNWKIWPKNNASGDPSLIVVHETGYDDPIYTREDVGVHFLVARDGTIYQLSPLDL